MVEDAPESSRFEPLSALWRALAAPQTLLILFGLLALALVVGSLIPQIPPQAVNEPQAWLAVQAGRFGPLSDLLRTVGLFDLYHAFWFGLLLGLVGLVLFVRALDAIELAWHGVGRKPWTAAALASWGSHPPLIVLTSSLAVDQARASVNDLLSKNGYRLTEVPGLSDPSLVADRRSTLLWARPLGYVALLLALIGLTIAGTWGWQNLQWQPVPGESQAVGHGTVYALRLDDFTLRPGAQQRLEDYSSKVTWLEGDAEVERDVVGIGRPATHHGVTVRQLGYVPLVKVRGWDADGQPLTLDTGVDVLSVTGEAEIRFSSAEAQPLIFVSDRDLILALTFEEVCPTGRPAVHVDRVQSGGAERQALGLFYESGSVLAEDLRLDVDLTFVPILQVDRRPAMGLVVAGMALLVIVLLLTWLLPPRLAWIAVGEGEDSRTRIQVLGLSGAGTQQWLAQLASRLREGLADVA